MLKSEPSIWRQITSVIVYQSLKRSFSRIFARGASDCYEGCGDHDAGLSAARDVSAEDIKLAWLSDFIYRLALWRGAFAEHRLSRWA